jgi:hypothetical protein
MLAARIEATKHIERYVEEDDDEVVSERDLP